MANLKDLRNRIGSVKSTRKITSAMKMVAASKLRRAQEAAESARPYAERMNGILGNLAAAATGSEGALKLLSGTGSDQTHLVVVMTANRGLCGGFNANIIRSARNLIIDLQAEGKTVKVLCVGRKGRDAIKREFGSLIIDSVLDIGQKGIPFSQADDLAIRILAMYGQDEFDVCTIVYNKFKSVIAQVTTRQQLIPYPLDAAPEEAKDTLEERAEIMAGGKAQYEYEPSEEGILASLLPRNVAMQIYSALLENDASEQGARMSAMDNATRNAGDMIDKLSLQYNRARQAAITTELTEIVAGAEAL